MSPLGELASMAGACIVLGVALVALAMWIDDSSNSDHAMDSRAMPLMMTGLFCLGACVLFGVIFVLTWMAQL